MYSASEIRKDASSDCCASMVKLLKLTEVGEKNIEIWLTMNSIGTNACVCMFPYIALFPPFDFAHCDSG